MVTYRQLIGIANYVDKSHRIFFFDSDSKELKNNELYEIVNHYQISLFMFETNKGFHFISFDFFKTFEIQSLFYQFLKLYPESDYKLISPRGLKFKGWNDIHVLRISPKTDKDTYMFYRCITPRINDSNVRISNVSYSIFEIFYQILPNKRNKNCFLRQFNYAYKNDWNTLISHDIKMCKYHNSKFGGELKEKWKGLWKIIRQKRIEELNEGDGKTENKKQR